jgi:hypothetical protein
MSKEQLDQAIAAAEREAAAKARAEATTTGDGGRWADPSVKIGALGVLLEAVAFFVTFVLGTTGGTKIEDALFLAAIFGLAGLICGIVAGVKSRGAHPLGALLGLLAMVLAIAGPILVLVVISMALSSLDLQHNAP